jgi:hypothetical protein
MYDGHLSFGLLIPVIMKMCVTNLIFDLEVNVEINKVVEDTIFIEPRK